MVFSVVMFLGGTLFAEDETEIAFKVTTEFFNKYIWGSKR